MNSLNPIEAAYIAGFVDGEGCISVYKGRSHGFEAFFDRVQITNTNLDILNYIQETVGAGHMVAHSAPKGSNRQAWMLVFDASQAQGFLQQILPYLRVKRQLAELLLTFPRGKAGRAMTFEMQEIRALIYTKIKEINSGQGVTTIPSGSTREVKARGSAMNLDEVEDI